jgi:hypothetical protein
VQHAIPQLSLDRKNEVSLSIRALARPNTACCTSETREGYEANPQEPKHNSENIRNLFFFFFFV